MIAVACDHGGYELKVEILKHLNEIGVNYIDCGTNSTESVDYPIYAKKVCKLIQNGEADRGILVCGTGMGMAMTANKFSDIRAAAMTDEFSAEMCRRHNNANVLCLGGRVLDTATALRLTDIFLTTPFDKGRHSTRVWMIEH